MRVLLRGNYAEGNFGDDALLLAACKLLARHAKEARVDGAFAYRDERLSGLAGQDRHDGRYDVIVYGGGTQFFEFAHDPPAKAPSLASRIIRKIVRPTELLGSARARRRSWREARKPRLAIGFGVGPFVGNGGAEAAATALLQTMPLVWVRDESSLDFCRRQGIEGVVPSADLCFTSTFATVVRAPRKPDRGTRRRRVGIVLRDWNGLDDAYFESAIEASRRLRSFNVETAFFSFSPRDRRLRAALRRAGEPVAAWGCERGSLERFWGELAAMDLVVTARFHGAVFALLSETPFLALAIEPKLEQVQRWSDGGSAPECILPPLTDAEFMTRRILAALEEAAQRTALARNMLSRQRRLASFGERRLAAYFQGDLSR
ncbi:MAG TPA: polysaccharide pyruvyl transferase family protein [Methylocystis sp.]|nr:polysaccharide pyruvyl transferase family protein [Methylocystis sp.]